MTDQTSRPLIDPDEMQTIVDRQPVGPLEAMVLGARFEHQPTMGARVTAALFGLGIVLTFIGICAIGQH